MRNLYVEREGVSVDLWSGDMRRAYRIMKSLFRYTSRIVAEETAGMNGQPGFEMYLPGHKAVVLGRVAETVRDIDAGRYLRSAIELMYMVNRHMS